MSLVSLLCSCTPDWVNQQTQLKNVTWATAESASALHLEFSVLQENGYHFGTVSFEGTEYDIALNWGNTGFDIALVNYYGEIIEENQDKKISGSYKIVKDKEIELTVHYDSVFNGQIVNEKMTINATTMDAAISSMDKHEICWSSENLDIYVYQCYRRFGVGACRVNGENKQIVFYWLNNNRFEMYGLVNGEQSQTVLATGGYVDGANGLELIFEKNDLLENVTSLLLQEEKITNIPTNYWYPKA